MYDQRFFASKLGLAALMSIAAMLTFNVYAFAQGHSMPSQVEATPIVATAAVLA